ncbi:sensor histidine kinase [Luteimonas abyssi]|uniref:sensor histidine kinase n=1 Tax=Luteimonas abyssi TaxID=1247514 RepID=UPI000737CB2E|nr:HAMP domain-containing sensor histidine kinase [Luteimonas abyssi]
MHPSPLVHWLRRPAIADPVDRRNAPMLQVVLLVLGTLPPLLWLYRIVGTDVPWRPGETSSLIASALISALALWSVVLIRTGRFQIAIRQLMAVVGVVTVVSHGITGLSAHIFEMPVQVLWLFVAGLMIGRRALWAMYAALVASLAAGALAEVRLGLSTYPLAFGDALIRAIMFLLVALVVDRSVAALREALAETRSQAEASAAANVRLQEEMAARERAQAQVIHAQKLEAAGRMASGLAHDFGHLLTLVSGYADQAARAEDPAARARALEGVRAAGRRAEVQVRKLLHFAREDTGAALAFDAIEAVAALEPMLRQTLGPRIRLELSLPDRAAPVLMDRERFDLVLLNLAANAADAMPDGGRFELRAACEDAGARLRIVARDSGPGIAVADRDRVFDAFFTTKPPGQGTGLGLGVSREVLRTAGGDLALAPQGDRGAGFVVTLPLRSAAAVPLSPREHVAHAADTAHR